MSSKGYTAEYKLSITMKYKKSKLVLYTALKKTLDTLVVDKEIEDYHLSTPPEAISLISGSDEN